VSELSLHIESTDSMIAQVSRTTTHTHWNHRIQFPISTPFTAQFIDHDSASIWKFTLLYVTFVQVLCNCNESHCRQTLPPSVPSCVHSQLILQGNSMSGLEYVQQGRSVVLHDRWLGKYVVKGRKTTGKFELNYLVKHSCISISRSMNHLWYHKDWQII